ncbi:MAG: hypothetical protein ACD_21C00153G0002 [uncultured bacterium]|nr:MAG: hypothetical protein ACD_21C00153G0002 [uncultured bacterium]
MLNNNVMLPTTVKLQVRTEPFVLARVAVLLRKYDVFVQQVVRNTLDDNREEITLTVINNRDNLAVALRKLERLVPVVTLQWEAAAQK